MTKTQEYEILSALEGIQRVINKDKDGSYFICEEAKEEIDNMNMVIEKYNKLCKNCKIKMILHINDGEMIPQEYYKCKFCGYEKY